MATVMTTRMTTMGDVEAVWTRVVDIDPLPANLDQHPLTAMSDGAFAAMVRTHLVPRENQIAGRHRWQQLWTTLAGEEQLRTRTRVVIESMLTATNNALALDDFAQGQRQRAIKFTRSCQQGLQRLQAPPARDTPLAWAGESAAAFNAPSRAVIARMVSAIATHRTAVASGGHGGGADDQLWAVLRATGLDPADHPQLGP